MYRWIDRFSNETFCLDDKYRSGHPITKCTRKNILKIENLIIKKPSITIEEINLKTKLSDRQYLIF